MMMWRLTTLSSCGCCWAALLMQQGSSFSLAPLPPARTLAVSRHNIGSVSGMIMGLHLQHDGHHEAAPSSSDESMINRRSILRNLAASAVGISTSTVLLPPNEASALAFWPSRQTTNNKIPTWTLDNNVIMPTLALNTVGLTADESERAVGYAVANGMTHIDFHPGKERDGVAQYLSNNKGMRKKLFLNTKIRKAPPGTSPEEAAERTRAQIKEDLAILGVDYVDMLMLRDSPDCEVIQAQWRVLEEALERGQCRSVGVINFCQGALECLLKEAKVTPALNYYMLHVGMGPKAHRLRTFCDARGIRTFAYGAVGEPGPNPQLLTNPTILEIATKYDRTPEEVGLRWVLQTGAAVSVRPTLEFGLGLGACKEDGSCELGISKRANSVNWALSAEDMGMLDGLTSPDDNPTLFSSAGCPGAFVMPKK